MNRKPTYGELEKKVKKLEKLAVTYSQFKVSLKESLGKQESQLEKESEPEMAVDLLEQEIEEHKPVEQALIAEHIFRRTIEDATPCGIAGTNQKGQQIYVNRVFCEMVGWKEDELIGRTYPFPYWPQEEMQIVAAEYQALIDGNVPKDGIELPFRTKTGECFWALVLSSALIDSEGKPVGQLISMADITRRKMAEKALRDLPSRLIDAQETERKIVSQEIHDSIGGKITGIKYALEKNLFDMKDLPVSLQRPLQEIIVIVQKAIEETQRIVKNLHPSVLDDLGILAAIRDLIHDYQVIYTHIKMKTHCDIPETDVPEALKILIYRILQEALNNVAKHSGADLVLLSLKKIDGEINLAIEDNGQGFNLKDVLNEDGQTHGMGLASMKERAEYSGGTFNLRSNKRKGTTIQISWPCE